MARTEEQWRATRELLKRAEEVIELGHLVSRYAEPFAVLEEFRASRYVWVQDFKRWEISEWIR